MMRRPHIVWILAAGVSLAGGAPSAGGPAPARAAEGRAVTISKGTAAPVIARADVLVVDSSLAGCLAARRIAAQGRSVILASTGTSLPREMNTALRLWASENALAKAPKDLAEVLGPCVRSRAGGEVIWQAAKLAGALEDMVLDAGVRLYYDLQPCGVVRGGGRVTAVLFACKAGVVAVEAAAVVDATPDARVAALAGAKAKSRHADGEAVELSYAMLCERPGPQPAPAAADVPELVGGKVLTHGPLAEFRIRIAPEADALGTPTMGLRARQVAAAAGRALRTSGAWKGAAFARGGDVVLAEPTRRITGRSTVTDGKLPMNACRPEGLENLLVCSPAADVPDAAARKLSDPLGGLAPAELVAAADWAALCRAGAADASVGQLRLAAPGAANANAAGEARFEAVAPIYRTPRSIPLGGVKLPVVASCDVLVVGGGTSGVPAAIQAAREGAHTLLIEKHGDVGGTHTIGGVSKYWFGRPTSYVSRLDAEASAHAAATGMPKCMGMLDALRRAGVEVVTHCLAVGAVADGGRVRGVVAATPRGLVAVTAACVIDATGDGDVAARAGAACEWGTARDALTLWYSFGTFRGARSEASRNFDSSVDLRDPADVTRAMIVSRRRRGIFGKGDFPQVYLAPRESRHVRGRATVTYADILGGRRRRDVVVVAQSNFDIKGIADSDLAQCGYAEREFRKNYTAFLPYRALLPEKLEGILVVGKAYSVTHDALALGRMQRDLMALGGAAGLAAATAVRDGKPPSAIDVSRLQRRLIELGILSQSHLADLPGPGDAPAAAADDELRRLVGEMTSGEPSLSAEAAVLLAGDAARPLLRQALSAATGAGKVRVARALCFLGDEAGANVLLAELKRQLAADALPKSPQRAHRVPDHGYAPAPAFLINTLGRLGDKRVLPLLAPLARRIRMNPGRSDDMFQYVYSICYACERLGDRAGIEALTVLADKPGIRGGVLPVGTDPRKSLPVAAERYAYLELCVARALARCGARRGYETLIAYLADIRGFLARSAREELADLTGRDFAFDGEAWRAWLARQADPLGVRPYRKRID